MNRNIIIAVALLTALPALGAKPKARKPAWSALQAMERAWDAFRAYDADALDEVIDDWTDRLKKNQETPQELADLQRQSVTLRNMLGRVEKITVVDSMQVDTADLMSVFRLSADAGKLGGTSRYTSYTPAGARELFYTAASDTTGHRVLMLADILDDGTHQNDRVIDLGFDENTDVAYPYMLADGSTLYFAANADIDGSLGGYDIYMTRRDDDGEWLEPTNVGMPYNSPGNDYMFMIDEGTGLGWFATDRNAPDGKVTVYVFLPNETRVNYDADTDGIADYARISSVAATQPEGFDAAAHLKALDRPADADQGNRPAQFTLSLGNGKVYTSLDDFRNATARNMMRDYLDDMKTMQAEQDKLQALRSRYAHGDRSVQNEILNLERKVDNDRRIMQNRRNAIITVENR